MSAFIRRFTEDPGDEVLLEIESVNILDLDPPASITGIGTGSVVLVGEYENGPYLEPTEVASVEDLARTMGVFGYNYAGVVANNPSARARQADGALLPEYWNGNAGVQLNGKKFKRLICCRADTSIGAVTFERQAFLTGAAAFAYNLEPAQVLALDVGAGPTSVTFSAAAAQLTGGAGVFPSLFVGGETLTIGYDDVPDFTVTFLAADSTRAQCVARINAYAGFTFAVDTGAAIRFTSRRRGSAAQARVIGASAAGVLTTLGLVAATTAVGTGNVADIDAVKFQEIKVVVETALPTVSVTQDPAGALRIAKVFVAGGDYIAIGPLTTAIALGFAVGQQASNDGRANYLSAAGVYPTTFGGTETLTIAYDNAATVVVSFAVGDQTQAAAIARINTALGAVIATDAGGGKTLFRGLANGGQVRILGASVPLVLSALGITPGTVSTQAVQAGTIPAGTLVQNTAATRVFVTTQDVDVTAALAGPYTARVRHALDDGTGASATAGSVTVIGSPVSLGSFFCQNLAQIGAAMTESQIDAAYLLALDATLDLNSPAATANIIYSARQSNAIRRALRSNSIDASSKGMYGRVSVVRPPLGTTRAAAMSPVAEPGVGAYRSDRVIYTFPGVQSLVRDIAARGLGGGAGFTATGIVDIGSDGFMAGVCSQLAPEENPGQLTTFTNGAVALESSPNAQKYDMNDYIAFKAAGIAAPRIDGGVLVFQSGVTSVDPVVYPNRKNISRRRMADFITDTLSRRAKAFSKKLSTNVHRQALAAEQIAFLDGLLSPSDPTKQRIAGYKVDRKSGNTAPTLAAGLYRIKYNVKTLPSLDSIVLQTTIGESVADVVELPTA